MARKGEKGDIEAGDARVVERTPVRLQESSLYPI
jgi:hypothetical protein